MISPLTIIDKEINLFDKINKEDIENLLGDFINIYIFFINTQLVKIWKNNFEFFNEKLKNLLTPFQISKNIIFPNFFYTELFKKVNELVSLKINLYFDKKFYISPQFKKYLNHDYIFNEYFKSFQKFVLSFFYNRNIHNYYGECLYEPDIEDPETNLIVIKVFFPYRDINKIINIWENFQLKEKEYINYIYFNNPLKKEILDFSKKNYLIFRSLQ